jgi:hypothetical protein
MLSYSRLDIAKYIYLVGFLGLAIGLPTSKVILSLSMMLMGLGAILEWNLLERFIAVFSNKTFLILFLFWLLHFIGLLWTNNFDYAGNDIRVKISLIILPVLIFFNPFEQQFLKTWINLFIATLIFTTIFNFLQYHGFILNKTYNDIRGLSFFGSHIRYGILVAIGAGICLAQYDQIRSKVKMVWLSIFIYFSLYTFYSQILSGALSLLTVIFIYFTWKAFNKSKRLGWTLTGAILVCISSCILFLSIPEKAAFDINNLPINTKYGNPYSHNIEPTTFVNGKAVLAFVCEKELQKEWEIKSKVPYNSLDTKKQPIRFTLMRYMTSKDLTKDKEGFDQLKDEDIRNIENGMTSALEEKAGILSRVLGIRYQLHNSNDPNGHSLLQRLEYWKTAVSIIQENWLLGVGTGDVNDAFQQAYNNMQSPLKKENRLRAHNSYLTAWVSFGVLGIVLFLALIIHFFMQCMYNKNLFGIMFVTVSALTFLIEDTLETQTGASFFAIFFGLVASQFHKKKKSLI